jgi:hypothetical protein
VFNFTLTCPLALAQSVSGFLNWVMPVLLYAEAMASAVNWGCNGWCSISSIIFGSRKSDQQQLGGSKESFYG